jgi:hypothetical protein
MNAAYEGDVEQALAYARAGTAHEADHEDRMCLAHVLYFMAIGAHRDEAMAIADDYVAVVEAAGVPGTVMFALLGKTVGGHELPARFAPTSACHGSDSCRWRRSDIDC